MGSPAKIKVLFNCSTNIVGGGIQNAYNFILNASNDSEVDWMFLVSPQVYDQLLLLKLNVRNHRIIKITNSPSKSKKDRKLILQYENQFDPDLVYTMGGPAYVKFKTYHIMGISNAYLTTAKLRTILYGRGLIESFLMVFRIKYLQIFLKRADFYFFQTETSRDAFCKRYHVKKVYTAIIPNAISNIFNSVLPDRERIIDKKKLIIFCPAAAYPHKGLHTLPEIALRLKKTVKDQEFKFVTTLPFHSKLWKKIHRVARRKKITDCFENMGPFDHKQAAELHYRSHIVFIPSVLETFSTSYLEGIAAKKPLLVADLPFAREVCGDHAQYMIPFSTKSAVSKLTDIILNYELHLQQFKNEDPVLNKYGDQEKRYSEIKKNLLRIQRDYIKM